MKFIIILLLLTYISSINYSYDDTILCVSSKSNTVILERGLQNCDHHDENENQDENETHNEENNSIKKITHENDCKDYKLSDFESYNSLYKSKISNKNIKTINKFNYILKNYNYKISFKSEIKKKLNFNKLNIAYSSIPKQIKSTIILT